MFVHRILISATAVILVAASWACERPAEPPASPPPPPPPNTLTEEEVADGWELLFDGESFAGWSMYQGEPVDEAWQIDDGALMVVPGFLGTSHDILTNDEYENFELRLEWRVAPGANSGIFYLVRADSNLVKIDTNYAEPWSTGPEMQVLDNARHADGQFRTHRAGDLYDLIAGDSLATRPVGEWNEVRLIVDRGKVEHWLNGQLVVSYELWTDEWDELVSNSKFAEYEEFGANRVGHISLQEHDDQVWFRNIKIRRLP